MHGVWQQFTLTQKKLQETQLLTVCAVVTDFPVLYLCKLPEMHIFCNHFRKAEKCSLISHSWIFSVIVSLCCFCASIYRVQLHSVGHNGLEWEEWLAWVWLVISRPKT